MKYTCICYTTQCHTYETEENGIKNIREILQTSLLPNIDFSNHKYRMDSITKENKENWLAGLLQKSKPASVKQKHNIA